MSLSTAVLRELMAAGLSDEALLAACARIEAADPCLEAGPLRTKRQARNHRYYVSKRLKASESDDQDANSDASPSPRAHAELEPKNLENSYLKTPLKGVKKGKVLASIEKPKTADAECLTELGKVLDPCHAQAVLDHRNRIRKPMTPYAAAKLAGSLAQADDPNAAADEMIERGWQGWKPGWGQNRGPPATGSPRRGTAALDSLDEYERMTQNVQQFPRLAG